MKKIIIDKKLYALVGNDQSLLKRSDISIFTSESNENAFHIHQREKADLVISYLDTQKMSGEEFCSLVRSNVQLCKTSIIMVGSDDKPYGDRIQRCRANFFLKQPLILHDIYDKAHELLNIAKRGCLRVPLGVKVEGKYNDRPFLAFSENISASGMLFQSDKDLCKYEIALCAFLLPDSARIFTTMKVMRVVERKIEFEPNIYGVRFIGLDQDSMLMIEKFVEGRQSREID